MQELTRVSSETLNVIEQSPGATQSVPCTFPISPFVVPPIGIRDGSAVVVGVAAAELSPEAASLELESQEISARDVNARTGKAKRERFISNFLREIFQCWGVEKRHDRWRDEISLRPFVHFLRAIGEFRNCVGHQCEYVSNT